MTSVVFVYGTLKTGEPNNYLLKDQETKYHCVNKGIARTVDAFPLVVASRYNVPYLLHKPGSGQNVVGELYEVDADLLNVLDDLESHPDLYERLETKVRCLDEDGQAGEVMTAMAYFLVKYQPCLLELPFLERYRDLDFGKYVARKDRDVKHRQWWYEVHTGYQPTQ